MKIGVFDSGVGGLSVANAVKAALPSDEVILRDDKEHIPYGNRTPEELLTFVVPILQNMVAEGCQVIIIACNTVSTTIVSQLREQINVPLIATEPMVKPAAQLTKSGVIAVCATPATLASARYTSLKEEYAQGVEVIEPDCSKWSDMIEADQVDKQNLAQQMEWALAKNADVIVLGCTHYHWIETEIKALVTGKAQVMQPEPALIEQLKRVIAEL